MYTACWRKTKLTIKIYLFNPVERNAGKWCSTGGKIGALLGCGTGSFYVVYFAKIAPVGRSFYHEIIIVFFCCGSPNQVGFGAVAEAVNLIKCTGNTIAPVPDMIQ